VMISESAAKWLAIMDKVAVAAGVILMFSGVTNFIRQGLTQSPLATVWTTTGPLFVFAAPLAIPFVSAQKLAATLTSDTAVEARKMIEKVDLNGDEVVELNVEKVDSWEGNVVPMIEELKNKTLPLLSSGFGLAIVGAFAGAWSCRRLCAHAQQVRLRRRRLRHRGCDVPREP